MTRPRRDRWQDLATVLVLTAAAYLLARIVPALIGVPQ